MAYPRLELAGKRFGKLTVVKEAAKSRNRNVQWETLCDCGKTHIATSSNLNGGHVSSCGCAGAGAGADTRERFPKSLKYVFGRYRSNCKAKGREFALSFEDVAILVSSPCFYFGTEAIWTPTGGDLFSSDLTPDTVGNWNGIDRIDNARGYTHGNVLPCSWIANLLRVSHFATGA